jgi:hypothetical protein
MSQKGPKASKQKVKTVTILELNHETSIHYSSLAAPSLAEALPPIVIRE